MDSRLLALRAVLNRLGALSFDSIESKIAFQKRVYLAQALGIPLGYGFSWNQYGPYSQELSDDRGLLGEPFDDEEFVWPRFRPEFEAKVESLLELIQPPSEVNLTAWLELLASLHFLADAKGVDISLLDNESGSPVVKQLVQLKPYFVDNEELIVTARQRLSQAVMDANGVHA